MHCQCLPIKLAVLPVLCLATTPYQRVHHYDTNTMALDASPCRLSPPHPISSQWVAGDTSNVLDGLDCFVRLDGVTIVETLFPWLGRAEGRTGTGRAGKGRIGKGREGKGSERSGALGNRCCVTSFVDPCPVLC